MNLLIYSETVESEVIKNIIQKFNNTKILTIGDLMIYHYLRGTVIWPSPEAPVLIVDIEDELYELEKWQK